MHFDDFVGFPEKEVEEAQFISELIELVYNLFQFFNRAIYTESQQVKSPSMKSAVLPDLKGHTPLKSIQARRPTTSQQTILLWLRTGLEFSR